MTMAIRAGTRCPTPRRTSGRSVTRTIPAKNNTAAGTFSDCRSVRVSSISLRTFPSREPVVLVAFSHHVTAMKQSDVFRDNAENCLHLAERAKGQPAFKRYLRMAEAWAALAHEQ